MADLKAVEVSLKSKGELYFIKVPYKSRDRTFKNQSDRIVKLIQSVVTLSAFFR